MTMINRIRFNFLDFESTESENVTGTGVSHTSPLHPQNTQLSAPYTTNKSLLAISHRSAEIQGEPHSNVDGEERVQVSSHKVFHNGVGDGVLAEHSRKSSSESGSSSVGDSVGRGSEQEEDSAGGVLEGEGDNSNSQPSQLTVR